MVKKKKDEIVEGAEVIKGDETGEEITFEAKIEKIAPDEPEVKTSPEGQDTVTETTGAKVDSSVKTIDQLADEVMAGVHGSGRERMLSLGSNYAAVQKEVNRRIREKK